MEQNETYKEAINKLAEFIADTDQGELDVDELSENTKEAYRLIKICKEKLYMAEEELKKVLDELQ